MRQIDCARLRHRRMLWLLPKGFSWFFYHKLKLEHLSKQTFSHNSKKALTEISQILLFFDFETCDSTDVPASNYARKIAARPFDTIHDILRCLSLAQSLLKGRNAPIWRIGNRGVNYWLSFELKSIV